MIELKKILKFIKCVNHFGGEIWDMRLEIWGDFFVMWTLLNHNDDWFTKLQNVQNGVCSKNLNVTSFCLAVCRKVIDGLKGYSAKCVATVVELKSGMKGDKL